MPVHKHLIIRAEVNRPLVTEATLRRWLRNLVKKIDMKILKGPYAAYVTKEGNQGVTGIVMIETSHIAIHIWDENLPALVQCDVYSCAEFSVGEVLRHFIVMQPLTIEHVLFDRSKTIDVRNKELLNVASQ